jgi:hypothetical protein
MAKDGNFVRFFFNCTFVLSCCLPIFRSLAQTCLSKGTTKNNQAPAVELAFLKISSTTSG